MIIFRPHRSTLAEAMKEVKEFDNVEAMKKQIVESWNHLFTVDDLVIDDESVVNDKRISWEDTKYVCVRSGTEEFVVGMCATKYVK